MISCWLKDGNLREKLEEKNLFEFKKITYLDKEAISPELWAEEEKALKSEGIKNYDRYRRVPLYRITDEGKLPLDTKRDFRYLMKAFPDEVFVFHDYFSDDKDIPPYWKDGDMYNPDTGTNVYGRTVHLPKDRIKPVSDKDKVNVEMYVEFGPNNYLNDVRHCYLTLPKEDMYESKNHEGYYCFYLREPEVELNSLDNKGEKFKVDANFITLYHPIGEYINERHEIEKRKKQEKDVSNLAETIRDRDSVDYELF